MSKVDIVAEIGVNHDGDFDKAVRMMAATADAGVKIVKFQHYDALRLLGPDSPYLEYASSCQFSKQQHELLKEFADKIGLEYLVSVFDVADIPWADSICKRHKVASRMNKDIVFIETLAATGKEVIISVQDSLPKPIITDFRYMFCITEYPTSERKLEELPCSSLLGLSSHCPSIQPTLKAISQGANLVEHHVRMAGDEEGCDKSSSIDFNQLKQLNRFANVLEIV